MMLYLIPTPIGDGVGEIVELIPKTLEELDYLIVENVRTARRFIASLKLNKKIDDFEFVELNEHTNLQQLEQIIDPIVKGKIGGIMSEAGVPCVADPGAKLVELAHKKGVEVKPLVGSSSIMLALMASGANGQSFAFNGYIAVKEPIRSTEIKRFEANLLKLNQTQIFIEAPYRNNSLLHAFVKECRGQTMLTIAYGINTEQQKVIRKSINEWGRSPEIVFDKVPAIFILG